jgi:hypothetical protein
MTTGSPTAEVAIAEVFAAEIAAAQAIPTAARR